MKETFLLTEVAALCGVSRMQLFRWARSGRIKSRLVPGSRRRRIEWHHLIPFLLAHDMEDKARSLGWDKCHLFVGADAGISFAEMDGRWLRTPSLLEAGDLLRKEMPASVVVDFSIGRRLALDAGAYLKTAAPWARTVAAVYEDESEQFERADKVYDAVVTHPLSGLSLMKAVA